MIFRYLLALFTMLMLVSCIASVTEVVPAGKDTYIVAGDDSLQEVSGARIKTSLYKEANAYCETMGKKLQPLDESVSSYAAELRFRCIDEDDPEYIRPIMETVPDVKIETD